MRCVNDKSATAAHLLGLFSGPGIAEVMGPVEGRGKPRTRPELCVGHYADFFSSLVVNDADRDDAAGGEQVQILCKAYDDVAAVVPMQPLGCLRAGFDTATVLLRPTQEHHCRQGSGLLRVHDNDHHVAQHGSSRAVHTRASSVLPSRRDCSIWHPTKSPEKSVFLLPRVPSCRAVLASDAGPPGHINCAHMHSYFLFSTFKQVSGTNCNQPCRVPLSGRRGRGVNDKEKSNHRQCQLTRRHCARF